MIQMGFSFAVFLFSVLFFMKNRSRSFINKILFLILATLTYISFIVYIISYYFSGNGLDEAMLYHMMQGVQGAGFKDYLDLIYFISGLLLLSVVFIFFLAIKIKPNDRLSKCFLAYGVLISSLFWNSTVLGMLNYFESGQLSSDFYNYYNIPKLEKIKENTKNFVYIYCESLEQTYFNDELFPGLLENLKKIRNNNISFTDIRQVKGTSWTIGGITGSQCGIPLVTPSYRNRMSGVDLFMPGAVCMGDLLNKEGYYLAYMAGARLSFAGKGNFLKNHGFDELHGKAELTPRLPDPKYRHTWGLYDDSLFEFAFEKYIDLSEMGVKFGLVTLTLDTHHPNGHVSKTCKDQIYGDGTNPILNAIHCSDLLLSTFIKRIQNSPYADNTIIVISSDHLAMRNTATELLKQGTRKNTFFIIDPSNEKSKTVDVLGSTFDIASTFLPFIGYKGNIGFGKNILDKPSWPNVTTIDPNTYSTRWKEDILRLWKFPQIKKSITVKANRKVLTVDNRELMYPIFLEFNSRYETIPRFRGKSKKHRKALVEIRKKLDPSKSFLMVEKCDVLNNIVSDLKGEGFCIVIGKGDKNFYHTKLTSDKNFSKSTLKNFL